MTKFYFYFHLLQIHFEVIYFSFFSSLFGEIFLLGFLTYLSSFFPFSLQIRYTHDDKSRYNVIEIFLELFSYQFFSLSINNTVVAYVVVEVERMMTMKKMTRRNRKIKRFEHLHFPSFYSCPFFSLSLSLSLPFCHILSSVSTSICLFRSLRHRHILSTFISSLICFPPFLSLSFSLTLSPLLSFALSLSLSHSLSFPLSHLLSIYLILPLS